MVDIRVHKHGLFALVSTMGLLLAGLLNAQSTGPVMLDSSLGVRAAASGLTQPITIAFIGENDMLVLEKSTGRVQRIVNGVVHSTVLDLAVNFGSERGLLGVAL